MIEIIYVKIRWRYGICKDDFPTDGPDLIIITIAIKFEWLYLAFIEESDGAK